MPSIKLSKKQSERIKSCIAQSGIKQKELAEKIYVTEQHLSAILAGKRSLTEGNLKTIASVFGVSEDYLTGKIDYPTWNEVRWKKNVEDPMEIDRRLGEILSLLGYDEIESERSEDYFTLEMPIPDGRTRNDVIPYSEMKAAFKGIRKIRPHYRQTIVRKKDGKKISVQDDGINSLYDDIIDFIKWRIDKEFR